MVRIMEPEVARAFKALWASAASLSPRRGQRIEWWKRVVAKKGDDSYVGRHIRKYCSSNAGGLQQERFAWHNALELDTQSRRQRQGPTARQQKQTHRRRTRRTADST